MNIIISTFAVNNMKYCALICVSVLLLQATVIGQDCNGNLVDALSKCASSIQANDTLSVQQTNCAPGACNYDCPSANAIDELSQKLLDVSATVQQLTTKVDANAADMNSTIQQLTTKVDANAADVDSTIQQLTTKVDANAADVDSTIQQLTTKVDANAADVDSTIQQLTTKVNANVADISTIKQDQTDTNSMIQTHTTNIDTNADDISTIKQDQMVINSTVQTLLTVQDTLRKSVNNNTNDIDELMEHVLHPCGSAGWTRIAYLDMSDPEQNCLPEFMEYSISDTNGINRRACGRQTSSSGSCDSKYFEANMTYSEVCGIVQGYQKGSPQGIHNGGLGGHNDLDSYYVDGISITYGQPRQHVWTFIGSNKDHGSGDWVCPCNIASTKSVQSFIGDDYFCESGYTVGSGEPVNSQLYTDDILWDGESCTNKESPCCQIPGLPWFTRTLANPTSDFIELRVCGDQGTAKEDVPIFYYEIYVK